MGTYRVLDIAQEIHEIDDVDGFEVQDQGIWFWREDEAAAFFPTGMVIGLVRVIDDDEGVDVALTVDLGKVNDPEEAGQIIADRIMKRITGEGLEVVHVS